MKAIAAVLASLWLVSAAMADSCQDQGMAKKISGAALTSFVDSCIKKTCTDKVEKLSGAARTSSLNKCLKDECDARAAKLSGAAQTSSVNKCIKDAGG